MHEEQLERHRVRLAQPQLGPVLPGQASLLPTPPASCCVRSLQSHLEGVIATQNMTRDIKGLWCHEEISQSRELHRHWSETRRERLVVSRQAGELEDTEGMTH